MSSVNFIYNNGDIAKDRVTGLEGVVMVRAEYSTGCHHYGIQPRETIDTKEPDWTWFDQSRLDLVESKGVVFKTQHTPPSGPFPAGPKV
ncbi:MAG: hypothetical protein GY718_01870 [Lentisphaerae bacterium]|nr:hypothetical protein [Lentisphaerota bacterium]